VEIEFCHGFSVIAQRTAPGRQRRFRCIQYGQNSSEKCDETRVISWYIHPCGLSDEGYFLIVEWLIALRRDDEQSQACDGGKVQCAGSRVLQGIGIGRQLPAVKGSFFFRGVRGLVVDDAVGSILEFDHCVKAAADHAHRINPREGDGCGFNPFLLVFNGTCWQAGGDERDGFVQVEPAGQISHGPEHAREGSAVDDVVLDLLVKTEFASIP